MKNKNKWFFITVIVMITSCVEPFEIKDIAHESKLVVNAIITNELKNQIIKLSRTTKIDSTGISPEKNARISIIDDSQNVYQFKELNDGEYQSINQFNAIPDKSYTLKIETQNGENYSSTPEKLTETVSLENIEIKTSQNETEDKEVKISINNSYTNDTNKYYRFEYHETYKITPFSWNPQKAIVVSRDFPFQFDLIPNPDPKYCYVNKQPTNIIIAESPQLTNYVIKSKSILDRAWSLRYSILIKEYVLNEKSYNYYKLVKKFSNPTEIFSQIQVGTIPNNISSNTNPDNKAIGLFQVSAVSSKRIFINREDLTDEKYIYPGEEYCDIITPEKIDPFSGSPLISAIDSNNYLFSGITANPSSPYKLISKPCGDCTYLGETSKPSFWID
ncbi:DUF4249 domain-containing protein [Tenacibaculum soleae]|uniref:DUF4249 domain-containing protein n=1 Tax=Tenacibaculum soleae TaxID=447689 RepID=A0A1B9XXZ7_9FLAO|nr:DUF4249 domain-containing protein [Tenacibaculum soleae]MDO6744512.1 DUF4249 domain-containing protein [Tenacibaculum soleae]MDO6813391.1 DUF4249 domain-containing protein [Tenacibaculum soleae]OCK42424.1 hypothetical protein BA195_09605 [Tenacibaculum soleae]